MDGYETTAHIKRRARTRDIPIILVSAYDRSPHATFRGYAAGAIDYVSRPYDPWVLRAKVNVYVDLHRKNVQLRDQTTLLRTGPGADLLVQLSTLLSDVETQANHLTGQLRAQASSTAVRAKAADLERAIRGLREALRGGFDASREQEPDTPQAPASLHTQRRRDQ